jgi:anti-sigma factor RsiW
MNNTSISRAVILDLLPAYVSGEATPDTRALVDAYAAEHPDIAGEIRRLERDAVSDPECDVAPAPDLEMRTLARTRARLGLQRWLFGLAIGFTTAGLAVVIPVGGTGVRDAHLLLQDSPALMGSLLALGLVCWVAYFLGRRRP